MRSAAFDLSSLSGVARWDGVSDKPVLFKKSIIGWDGPIDEMLEGWRRWLGKFFEAHDPQLIGIEGMAMGSHGDAKTIEKQAMLAGMLIWACGVSGRPYYRYAPSTWRKEFIGFGQKPKTVHDDWKVLARKRCKALDWDYQNDHNAAEAGGVLVCMLNKHRIATPWRDSPNLNLPLDQFTYDSL